ncbi:MAG: DUF2249 domain-containing protein [Chryseobacterium sp.]|nr:DUF2249 domain-containing protein [Chryseobacterium sp.]
MKTITEKTKISELIKEDPESINAIASIAKPLEKLKNPILRKIMASRVTIAEAAKMGGATVEDFIRVLRPLGFHFEETVSEKEIASVENKPEWLQKTAEPEIDFYDVRPIIDNGADPLKEILHRFKETPSGKILCIINSFIPTPLIHLLKQEKAEDTFTEIKSEKLFYTYFLKKEKQEEVISASSEEKLLMHNEESFGEIYSRFSQEQLREIDVRSLEMPGPMEAILSELEDLPEDHALYIHHKRVPVYLLEELADKDFEVHIYSVDEGNVKMLIFKK